MLNALHIIQDTVQVDHIAIKMNVNLMVIVVMVNMMFHNHLVRGLMDIVRVVVMMKVLVQIMVIVISLNMDTLTVMSQVVGVMTTVVHLVSITG